VRRSLLLGERHGTSRPLIIRKSRPWSCRRRALIARRRGSGSSPAPAIGPVYPPIRSPCRLTRGLVFRGFDGAIAALRRARDQKPPLPARAIVPRRGVGEPAEPRGFLLVLSSTITHGRGGHGTLKTIFTGPSLSAGRAKCHVRPSSEHEDPALLRSRSSLQTAPAPSTWPSGPSRRDPYCRRPTVLSWSLDHSRPGPVLRPMRPGRGRVHILVSGRGPGRT